MQTARNASVVARRRHGAVREAADVHDRFRAVQCEVPSVPLGDRLSER